ncbi:MAG: TlyA family RNA methyltransferase, partial [Acholeplasmataceae bacterium]|nr:TlyA family RNA methyltransferase [Acholeplasmataceae bacterium]
IKSFLGEIIVLIKPQYEVGKIKMSQGVLKDIKKHQIILNEVLSHVISFGFYIHGLQKAAIKGKTGNQEYVLYMKKSHVNSDLKKMVGAVLC